MIRIKDTVYTVDEFTSMVRDFHETFKHPVVDKPQIPVRKDLRLTLIKSETRELEKAYESGDVVEMIDAYCDLLYVVHGAMIESGVQVIMPFFEEVHRTNMAKVGGATRADGKTLKPPGWQPPRIKEILEEITTKKIEIGMRVYHRRADLFGTVNYFSIDGIMSYVKYEPPSDPNRGEVMVRTEELVPDFEAPTGE